MSVAGNKNPQQAAGYGKKEKQRTVYWPENYECAKCLNSGLLPVAWGSKNFTRINTGVAACDCPWGDTRQTQNPGIGSYYDFPYEAVDKEAKTYTQIKHHFMTYEALLIGRLEEKNENG